MVILIIVRLAFWQIIKADELTARAEGQRVTTKEVSGLRGKILFSDNSVLASNKPSYLVFAQPLLIKKDKKISDDDFKTFVRDYAQKLSIIFWEEENKGKEIEPDIRIKQIKDLEEALHTKLLKNLSWVSLVKKVDLETKKKIEDLNLTGIGFDASSSRLYPEGSSSAHLLGFVAADLYGNDKGYHGIEGYYNGELGGKKGEVIQEKDALGLPILIGKFLSKKPTSGKNLILNIDRSIQYIVEEKIKKGLEKYGAKGASAVVLEPKTGNILAMASYPGYDPQKPSEYPEESLKNPITVDGYEPGSTFKVLVMAAGINEGVIKKDTKCDICQGPINIGGFTIRTWNNQYRPDLIMTDVIVHSDNTGMVFVSKKLGIEKFYKYIKDFGFGNTTGIDLEDETSPPLREKDTWKEIDQATASFGQGISVTAMQVIRAVGAIANGGKLLEPHIVSKIMDEKGIYTISPRIISTPINPETAKEITEMMVKAVDDGEAKFAKKLHNVMGYKIAGKTGTAQIPVAGHYDPSKTIASFVGFAPADDPKFVMLVRYDQPTSSIYGAETAAPTFFEIARDLFIYYGIAPTEQ